MSEEPDKSLTEAEIKRVIAETVAQTLLQMGIDAKDPLEMQRDFQHLRSWRKSVDDVKSKGLWAAVTFITVAMLGAMALGFKEKLLH